jgi:hypothetical protein
MEAVNLIRVYRTPLETGEVPYALRRIYVGINPKTGKEFPLSQALPKVLEDGGLHWEIPDNERNRAYVKAACADKCYTVVYPGDTLPVPSVPKVTSRKGIEKHFESLVKA